MFSKLLFFALCLLFCPKCVRNSGFFELQFLSPAERLPEDYSRVSVCLKELLNTFSNHNECTFGHKTLDVSLSSSLALAEQQFWSLKIPFTFRWTGSFSLIIEMQARGGERTQRHLISDPDAAPAPPKWKHRTLQSSSERTSVTVRYRVVCDQNYHRNDCATFCRSRDDTFGHYVCDESGRKVCQKGWSGENCDRPKCRDGCNEMHGFCELPDQCTCKHGWKGANCDLCAEYPGCLHGYCMSPFQCICHRNWGGILCDQDLNYCGSHDPCLNEGQCQNVAPDHYRCLCRPGFEGQNCQTVTDSCATAPCLHAGRCLSLRNGSDFQCVCKQGFEGKRCENDVNECRDEPCLHGGTCHDLIADFKCHCGHGWTGRRCEVDVDECVQLRPCVHAHQCLNREGSFECVCETGFEGKQCETEVNDCEKRSIDCKNGGICLDLLDDFRCVCVDHFSGQFCQQLDESVCQHQNNDFSDFRPSDAVLTSGHLLWRFNDTTTARVHTMCPKVCLCDGNGLKCSHECRQSTDPFHSSDSCRQWRSSAHIRSAEVKSESEIKLIFETKVSDVCNTLLTIHSLISKSRDFCCLEVPELPEVIVHSRHAHRIHQYVSARVWPQLTRIVFKRPEESTDWTAIAVTIVVAIIVSFVTIVLIFVFFKRKTLLKRNQRTGENVLAIHCIQNNLKSENERNLNLSSKSSEKLFLK